MSHVLFNRSKPLTPRADLVESVLFGKQFGILGSSEMTGRIILLPVVIFQRGKKRNLAPGYCLEGLLPSLHRWDS